MLPGKTTKQREFCSTLEKDFRSPACYLSGKFENCYEKTKIDNMFLPQQAELMLKTKKNIFNNMVTSNTTA